MIRLELKGDGLKRFFNNAGNYNKKLGKVPVDTLLTCGRVWKEEAKTETLRQGLVKKGTYLKAWSVTRVHLQAQTKGSVEISNKAKHAGYLEFGTRPHVIYASRAKALRFFVKGKAVFAKYVFHPGTRAYNVLSAATSKAIPKWLKILKDAAANVKI